jgi:hypothetical protein
MIKCPTTGAPVSTGIEVESETFDQLPSVGARLKCPACGAEHVWTRDDAWISGEQPPRN